MKLVFFFKTTCLKELSWIIKNRAKKLLSSSNIATSYWFPDGRSVGSSILPVRLLLVDHFRYSDLYDEQCRLLVTINDFPVSFSASRFDCFVADSVQLLRWSHLSNGFQFRFDMKNLDYYTAASFERKENHRVSIIIINIEKKLTRLSMPWYFRFDTKTCENRSFTDLLTKNCRFIFNKWKKVLAGF